MSIFQFGHCCQFICLYCSTICLFCLSVTLCLPFSFLRACFTILSPSLSVCMSVYLSVGLLVSLYVCLFVCLSVCLSVCLPASLSVCLPPYFLSVVRLWSVSLSVVLTFPISDYLFLSLLLSLSLRRSLCLCPFSSCLSFIFIPLSLNTPSTPFLSHIPTVCLSHHSFSFCLSHCILISLSLIFLLFVCLLLPLSLSIFLSLSLGTTLSHSSVSFYILPNSL